MQRIYALLLALILLALAAPRALAQAGTPTASPTPAPRVEILSPWEGQALQGNIAISGNTAVEGFQTADLEFAYQDDPTGTWFLIAQSNAPVTNGILYQWDTSTLTDGTYKLRLTVTLDDGSQQAMTVEGLRVRNYSPIETNTPTPVAPTATPEPGDTPVPTATSTPLPTSIPPTATALPPNPAQLTNRDVITGVGKGILLVVGLFAAGGVYGRVRSILNRGSDAS